MQGERNPNMDRVGNMLHAIALYFPINHEYSRRTHFRNSGVHYKNGC